ncbi:nickel/cobalt efflux transporter [Achromobacter seleniivolatilans]|uniref:Nickel/cobalt efflux system n=1 Tax=Achromobacter seleniivolatilans TaxID=3047478 RepID=A0ABY9LZB6_9BURK|nr:nickel/cobalt efflux transporter [Achromobacter sp. R39]WMD19698.1 nickel/cobalt efflux transporter [Achromobacter sp. R39]
MLSFSDLIAQGSSHAWLFIPSAILLGALHGLEPGHSKTMMAAFIVAIRGSVWQAMLLGITATISHTLIVWGIGLGGMYLWRGVAAEELEPYFQLASGVIIGLIAAWMLWRTWRDQRNADHGNHHLDHNQNHGHGGHSHAVERHEIDTGHGIVALEVYEDGVPPRWRLTSMRGGNWQAQDVSVTTERIDGARHEFRFAQKNGYLESFEDIPEPHEFMARLTLGHGGHVHSYDIAFMEPDEHQHDHLHEEMRGLDVAGEGYQDAHQLAHANDIRRRFTNRNVTNWQIALFGLTGGLIPCPAAITVLLLCLQLKEFALGAVLVLCFSIGLALTLVTVGAVAALSVRQVNKRAPWLNAVAQRAPYLSSLLIIAVGIYVGMTGWLGIRG